MLAVPGSTAEGSPAEGEDRPKSCWLWLDGDGESAVGLTPVRLVFLSAEARPVLVLLTGVPTDDPDSIMELIDHGAELALSWSADRLRGLLEGRLGRADAETLVEQLAGAGLVEDFWRGVEASLRAGRMGLVLGTPELTDHAAEMIRFLDGQMRPTTVQALVLPQTAGLPARECLPALLAQVQL